MKNGRFQKAARTERTISAFGEIVQARCAVFGSRSLGPERAFRHEEYSWNQAQLAAQNASESGKACT